MESSLDKPPSPGPPDNTRHDSPPDDLCSVKTPQPENSQNNSPIHQGAQNTGGVNVKLKVLFCTNVNQCVDYDVIHQYMKEFGHVQRIKLKLHSNPPSYDAYVTFADSGSANTALQNTDGKVLFNSRCKASLMRSDNLQDSDSDYIPSMFEEKVCTETIRNKPKLTWHIASYKDGQENFLKASISLQKKVGVIPKGNLKRFGKGLLVKANSDIQANMLTKFSPSEEGNVQSVTPHRTFNTPRGVIYNRDLYEFSEEEILNLCPPSVFQVKKLNGVNNAILLTFSSTYIPHFIDIEHSRIGVKKFIPRPTQCHNCYDYGHVSTRCNKNAKCYVCSGEHDLSGSCSLAKSCFNCGGDHHPNWKGCPRYKFEQEVIMVANNEFVSFGSAKHIVMGANKDPEDSHASIVKRMKISKINHQNNAQGASGNSPPAIPIQRTSEQKRSPPSNEVELVSVRPKDKKPSAGRNETDKQKEKARHKGSDIIEMETESNIITISKKNSVKPSGSDGFIEPPNKRRAIIPSLENSCPDLETSNLFSVLEDNPVIDDQNVDDLKESNAIDIDDVKESRQSKSGKSKPRRSREELRSSSFNINLNTTELKEVKPPHKSNQEDRKPTKFPSTGCQVKSVDSSDSKVKRLNKNFSSPHTSSHKESMAGKKSK